MPNKPAAAKALRQTRKHAAQNRQVLADVEVALKQAYKTMATQAKDASAKVQTAVKTLDRAAQKGVIKQNNAARKKSRLMKALHATVKK
ncbi:MAG: 30S ribosomal protein S20 [Candidatus Kerfeldbacteria bacterium]|nr:30S ribosomal protein S20 [Candidatus Kerfeldbacteria bacterium]